VYVNATQQMDPLFKWTGNQKVEVEFYKGNHGGICSDKIVTCNPSGRKP